MSPLAITAAIAHAHTIMPATEVHVVDEAPIVAEAEQVPCVIKPMFKKK